MTHSFYPGDIDGGGAAAVRTRLPLLAIAATAIGVMIAVGVRGDFPLSDDWSYAHAARSLAETGRIELLPWTGASVVFQAWYGALLCWLFGCSFTVLRLSTLVLASSGVVAWHLFLRESGVRGAALALATAVVGLSPLYVNLSFSFMTDVPFTALVLWSAYFYVRGLRARASAPLLAGAILCAAALLVRQHGIFLAAAASLAALTTHERWSERLRAALAAGLVPAAALAAYLAWLYLIRGQPSAIDNKVAEAARATLAGTLNIGFRAIEYLGLLLSPLAAAAAPEAIRRAPKTFLAALVTLASCAAFLYVREGALMFYLPNVLYDFGLGAVTLRDVLFLDLEPPQHAGAWLGVLLTLASTLSAAVLVAAWSRALPARKDPARVFVLLSFALLFAGSLLHARFYFDRYLLPILPFAAALVVLAGGPLRIGAAAWLLTAGLTWYAIAGTHDYMAWNRGRYALLDTLEAEGVEASSIDGGMEYNAWKLAARLGTWPTTAEAARGQPDTRKSWWWVVDDTFVVSFRPLPGYAPKAQRTYPQWLIPKRGRVLLLQRSAAQPQE